MKLSELSNRADLQEDKDSTPWQKVDLYLTYVPVYIHIRKNPKLYEAMKNDEGVRWMHRVTFWIFAVLGIISFIGAFSSQ